MANAMVSVGAMPCKGHEPTVMALAPSGKICIGLAGHATEVALTPQINAPEVNVLGVSNFILYGILSSTMLRNFEFREH
jgi:hypothetical protein